MMVALIAANDEDARPRASSCNVRPEPERETSAMRLHTYLNYGGNCEQAFRFYEKHLGGKVTMMMTQGEQPNAKDVRPDQKNAILYARIRNRGDRPDGE